MVDNMMRNLQDNMKKLDKLNQQLSSGKKFSKPSENPIGAAESMELESVLSNHGQYLDNIGEARDWMKSSESALKNSGKILQRAREQAIYGANGSLSEGDRKQIAIEIGELKKELVNVANSKLGDRYLFSGQKTTTKPFTDNGDFQGSISGLKREVGPGTKMKINTNGKEVFADAIETLDSLEDNLNERASIKGSSPTANNFNGDLKLKIDGGTEKTINLNNDNLNKVVEEINNQTVANASITHDRKILIKSNTQGENSEVEITGGALKSVLGFDINDYDVGTNGIDQISEENITALDKNLSINTENRARIGAKINRLDMTESKIEEEKIQSEELLSKNEDVDIAKTITDLKMQESVYRASLASGARIIQPTLVDFLQ